MVIEQALDTFLEESEDLLKEIEAQLLILEKNYQDTESINALFRAIHTLKGSSGLVGVEHIEKFTHWVENVFERVRSNEITLDNALLDVFFKAYDHTRKLVDDIVTNGYQPPGLATTQVGELIIKELCQYLDETPDQPSKEPLEQNQQAETSSVESESHRKLWKLLLVFSKDTFSDGFDPSSFIFHLHKLGEIAKVTIDFDRIPLLEDFDSEICYLTVDIDLETDFEKKDIDEVFEFLGDDLHIEITPPPHKTSDYIEQLEDIVDGFQQEPEFKHRLGELLVKSGILTERELNKTIQKQQIKATDDDSDQAPPKIGELLVNDGIVPPEVLESALDAQKPIQARQNIRNKTIRIETEKLDKFIDLVGELVIANTGVTEHSSRLRDKNLIETAAVTSRLIEEIHERIMDLRMVSINETFNRFQRVVREFNKQTNKKIELDIKGNETELDKTVIEKIFDPLMHLVRNSADHGIESPEDRVAVGKPEVGTIFLNAYHDSGSVIIEVTDDGKGISRQKLLEKAIQNKLVPEDHHLTDAETLNLIFTPGLSTAKAVTKFSGRGVGLDVVKNNIEMLRGSVDIESEEGQGTTFKIRLPLTLAIIEGLLVGVGTSQYVIPLSMVVECVDMPEEAMNTSHHHLNLRGNALPFLWLRDVFEETGPMSENQNVVVIKYGDKMAGLVTDALYGEIQAVMKNLDEVYKEVKGVSGATIMGDGAISLILDVPRLIQLAENNNIQRSGSQIKQEAVIELS